MMVLKLQIIGKSSLAADLRSAVGIATGAVAVLPETVRHGRSVMHVRTSSPPAVRRSHAEQTAAAR